ncbi:MAG: hypothetical protein IJ418_12070 [Clostridia bacterium]|nr:hypothetical protein [Clostridia bacterium]
MEDVTIRHARNALVQAIHVLRHTPVEKLAKVYKELTGREMDNASMRIHADMYDQLYSMVIDELDQTHGPWQDPEEKYSDLSREGPA